ncbi:hypothetical protein GCM10026988_12270 [Vibrio panuliri]
MRIICLSKNTAKNPKTNSKEKYIINMDRCNKVGIKEITKLAREQAIDQNNKNNNSYINNNYY